VTTLDSNGGKIVLDEDNDVADIEDSASLVEARTGLDEAAGTEVANETAAGGVEGDDVVA
jgi:hypothetical protein